MEMTADLERTRSSAATAGYKDYGELIDNARRELTAGQPVNSASDEIKQLIELFQGQAQARGSDAAPLNLGIVLGWLQQGARANNRLLSLVTADLESVRTHAVNAQYQGYDSFINNAATKLSVGQPVSSILGEITGLIGYFLGQA
jgi:hypothetical protein